MKEGATVTVFEQDGAGTAAARPGTAKAVPTVSIGMPVFNGENYVGQAIAAVLAQSLTAFELIVCDNASTDATGDIARDAVRLDRRVRYERHDSNRGASFNFNRLFAVADPKARYLKWAAADDEHHPTYLSRTVALLDGDPGLVVAHSLTADIDDEGYRLRVRHQPTTRLGDPSPAARLRDLVTMSHECFDVFGVVRADALRSTHGLGPFSDADNVLLVELALRGRFGRVDDVLFLRRQHADRSVSTYRTSRQRVSWFDPARVEDRFPAWRIGRELIAAVHRAPLTASERMDCYRGLSVYVRHSWPALTKNVVRSAMAAAAGGAPARRASVSSAPDGAASPVAASGT